MATTKKNAITGGDVLTLRSLVPYRMERAGKTWMHYVRNIIAADVPSAVFLATYQHRIRHGHHYASFLEVMDLQRYKVISKKDKVRNALLNNRHTPFIFIIGKN
jgi:hypothetical protein